MFCFHTTRSIHPWIQWCILVSNDILYLQNAYISLCNPRDHCTHSLLQDCCIVKLITSNRQTYLHRGTAPWRWTVLYALVRKTMHGVIVGKRVRTRRLSDRYCTRFWMSGMFWCDQQDYATVLERRVRTKSRDYTGCTYSQHNILVSLTF